MRIVFLDCTHSHYNGETMRQKALGGIETVTVCLAEALAKQGHTVTVYNNAPSAFHGSHYGVAWTGADMLGKAAPQKADIVIANNDTRLFKLYAEKTGDKSPYPVLWIHNRMLLEKTIRKGRYPSFIKWRPHGVFLGQKHMDACSALHPFRRKSILPHGLSDNFLGQGVLPQPPAPPQAIFFSQAYRGFSDVVKSWVEHIHPSCNSAVLKAFVGDIDLAGHGIAYDQKTLAAHNIQFMPRVSKDELINHIRQSRVMIYPGHKDETFCNVATEANALGVPIVTWGIGALSERVKDGYNGYVTPPDDHKAMAEKGLAILTDDAQWSQLSKNAIAHVQDLDWNGIADMWHSEVFKYAGS